ncbi:MAG: hypothetical protein Q8P15_01700 [Nanoarchaeota archaeon]|nr:hypothetical protein [Nanoarchaeota archaeon]
MNLQFYLEKLHDSENFKKFMKENPEAYLCSGFFIIDKEGKDNKQHFDFFIPEKKETFSFQLEDNCKEIKLDTLDERIPEKVLLSDDVEFEYLEKLIVGEMFEQKINNKIQKILLSLQRLNGKDFLVGTVFISGLGILKVSIDIAEKKIIDFEKKSFFDMMKFKGKKKE